MKTRFRFAIIACCLLFVALASCQRPVPTAWANEEALLNQLVNRQAYAAVVSVLQSPFQSSDPSAPWLRLMWIRKKAEEGHVPMQFELSRLLALSNPTEALRWFAIARIGGTLDAALCADRTSKQSIRVLAMKYQEPLRATITNEDKYALALKEGLEWHERNPNRPSALWVCRQPPKLPPGAAPVIPKDQWQAVQAVIKKNIRTSLGKDELIDCTEGCQQFPDDPVKPFVPESK